MSDELEVDIIAPRGELSPGRTEGTIGDLTTHNHQEYGKSLDVELKINEEISTHAFYNFPTDGVSIQHDLGKLLDRFGADVEDGNTFNIRSFLSRGREVEFELEEDTESEEGGFNVVKDSLCPLGQGSAGGDGQEEEKKELSPGLQGVLDEMDLPESRPVVMGKVAGVDESLIPEFEEMVESGTIQTDAENQVVGY